MFLIPARIKDNRVSNFGSEEWMNSKVGLIEVKALVKPQSNNAVNCQALEINPEISIYVTGYWKTDHNVTLGQLHFIGPANSHTHALSMHCCITGLS